MKLTVSNTYIIAHGDGFTVNIDMPDGSRNYLHSKSTDLESAIIDRELIEDMDIDHMNLKLIVDEEYYRLQLKIKDVNDDYHVFHGRKVNLNDAIFERMQLLTVD